MVKLFWVSLQDYLSTQFFTYKTNLFQGSCDMALGINRVTREILGPWKYWGNTEENNGSLSWYLPCWYTECVPFLPPNLKIFQVFWSGKTQFPHKVDVFCQVITWWKQSFKNGNLDTIWILSTQATLLYLFTSNFCFWMQVMTRAVFRMLSSPQQKGWETVSLHTDSCIFLCQVVTWSLSPLSSSLTHSPFNW